MGRLKFGHKILISILILFILSLSVKTNKILFYPSNINVVKGENKSLDISFPFFLSINHEKENVVEASLSAAENIGLKKSYKLNGLDSGEAEIQLKLLGFIPIKNYNINVINRPHLIPGGNAIGVRLNTKGVLVVAVTDVIDVNGERKSPAKDAGLKVGDSILEINGTKVTDAQHVVNVLNDLKDTTVEILVQRNKAEFLTKSIPVKSIQDNCYRLGIWVRDKTSGIGTLTYYNKETNEFGALGHGIVDTDTGGLLSVEKGKIMNAKISKIEQGKKGTPGEIRGVFYETKNLLGDISINSPYGIYGTINEENLNFNLSEPIPIGFKEEVKEGKAYILSTVDDNKVEKFEIEITKIQQQSKADQKSMIVKITDSRLLDKTGGIVQGMSGSPIIQDDKLIGAITHVFVNDPTKGYGIYIEWMLEQTNKP
ncbi:SpoIVB peptidase [Tissierella pigra]|uniref:SpoIVB peptidase n=1 Tax=Tissierella pigra TaxID=2607614 RepID=A0A6N7XQA6_9FIRM|nr:SpoIVB peptidase [Tissierella pigra]MBU5426653.1 SpoIVB peptidase [Tissierella pigra]MST99906.1 SpoIVB peptidase [Tissierella pigra]